MIYLDVYNKNIHLKNADNNIIRKIQKITSYSVAGAFWTQSYKNGTWDGKENLLEYSRKNGYQFPTGLLFDVIKLLEEKNIKYEIKDKRKIHNKKLNIKWNNKIKLRKYQLKAKRSFIQHGGNGIIKIPTGGGKTYTAASIIQRINLPTIFIVPSKQLLNQTIKSLEKCLKTSIGKIGDGTWNIKNITVATIQTLIRADCDKNEKFEQIKNKFDLAIFDEVHHLKGNLWCKTAKKIDTKYNLGLSATVYFKEQSEIELGAIYMKGLCGEIIYDISTKYLIDKRFLVKPKILMYPITKPKMNHIKWIEKNNEEKKNNGQKLLNKCIYLNEKRNKKIIELTKKWNKSKTVLIITNRKSQVNALSLLLDKNDINHNVLIGDTSTIARDCAIIDFEAGKTTVIVGTVLSEGVDIPAIDVVINAEGGKDRKKTIQRLRNLRLSNGKEEAYFIDFIDQTHNIFLKHSKKRLNTYLKEKFEVEIIR